MTPLGRIERQIVDGLARVLNKPDESFDYDPFVLACLRRVRERNGSLTFLALVNRLMQGQEQYGELERFLHPGFEELDWEKEIDCEAIDVVVYALIQKAVRRAKGEAAVQRALDRHDTTPCAPPEPEEAA